MTITAAVDGSSLGNPGPAGWAWYVSPQVWDAGGWPSGTNNMGELTAVLELLRATAAADLADEPLIILADSQYAINCITKWMPGWKKKGWRKADGKEVANRDILEELDKAIQGRDYKFEWVRGHNGHDMNEAADERARAVSEAYQAGRPIPSGPGFSGESGIDSAAGPAVINTAAPADDVPPASPSEIREAIGGAQLSQPEPVVATAPPRDSFVGQPAGDGPISVISAREVGPKWPEVLDAAAVSPVTITRVGRAPLMLLDAELAQKALASLEQSSQ